jgi:predicted metal-binding membrane protein
MAQTTRSPQPEIRLIAWMESWLLAGLAWIPTVGQAQGMSSTPGSSTLGTMGMPLGAFLGFWTLMMAAMMLPTLAPRLALHLEMARLQTRGLLLAVRAGGLMLGYLLVWAACGLPIYGLAVGEAFLIVKAPSVALEARAIVLVAVGLYQLTPLQARCLASCQRHLDRQPPRQALPAALYDVGTGMAHGIDCLGTCGGLMLLLVIVGLMNLPWMLVITLIVVLEKGWPYGHHLALVVGIGLLLLGILVAGDPGLLPGGPLGAIP